MRYHFEWDPAKERFSADLTFNHARIADSIWLSFDPVPTQRTDVPHPHYSNAEIAERGQDLYERTIRDQLKPSESGKLLVVDIETGDYEIDADDVAAVKRARAKRPDGAFYILRVGHPTAYRLGRKALAVPAC